MSGEYNRIWGEFGITLEVTPKEMELLYKDPNGEGRSVLATILAEGRAIFDDESYIPSSSIQEYNRENRTRFYPKDVELNTALIQGIEARADMSLEELEQRMTAQKNRGDAR